MPHAGPDLNNANSDHALVLRRALHVERLVRLFGIELTDGPLEMLRLSASPTATTVTSRCAGTTHRPKGPIDHLAAVDGSVHEDLAKLPFGSAQVGLGHCFGSTGVRRTAAVSQSLAAPAKTTITAVPCICAGRRRDERGY